MVQKLITILPEVLPRRFRDYDHFQKYIAGNAESIAVELYVDGKYIPNPDYDSAPCEMRTIFSAKTDITPEEIEKAYKELNNETS